MQSGCRWVYTLMDWDTGEVVAKGTSVELVEQGYFPDVNKLSSVWNNLEKCKNPSPKSYRWKMERKSTKDDRVERARAEGLSADERAETRMVRVYSCYGADGTLLGKVKNMHREYVYEVKPLLTAGENTLRLEFKSPRRYFAQQQHKHYLYMNDGDTLPGAAHLRKAMYQSGWDWGVSHS